MTARWRQFREWRWYRRNLRQLVRERYAAGWNVAGPKMAEFREVARIAARAGLR